MAIRRNSLELLPSPSIAPDSIKNGANRQDLKAQQVVRRQSLRFDIILAAVIGLVATVLGFKALMQNSSASAAPIVIITGPTTVQMVGNEPLSAAAHDSVIGSVRVIVAGAARARSIPTCSPVEAPAVARPACSTCMAACVGRSHTLVVRELVSAETVRLNCLVYDCLHGRDCE